MDTDGRQTEEGGGKILAESNVVRLPRDWLGPRDELIPFGQPVDEPAAEASEPIGLPPTAKDFWGGEVASAAVPDSVPSRVSRAGAREAISRRARPISIIGMVLASAASVLALIAGATPRSAVREPRVSGAAESARGSKAAVSPPAHRQSGRAFVAALGLRAESAATLRANQRSAGRRARRGNPGLAQRSQSVHASTSTPTAQPVHYTSSTPSTTSTPASSAEPPTTTGSSSTNGQTASSGAQTAFGPNGALGPGSSPDG